MIQQTTSKSKSQRAKQIKGEIDLIVLREHDPFLTSEKSPSIVNCLNGEVWIDNVGKAELKPHSYLSWQTSCLPFEYDKTSECKVFVKALMDIFAKSSNPDAIIAHLFEIMGYVIQNTRNVAVWVFFIGEGRNGKSKLIETIVRLLGPEAKVNMSLSTFQSDRFNITALRGKKIFVDDDMKMGTKLNDGLLKTISEGKSLTARTAYGKGHLDFESRVVPLLASNHYPITDDISPGFVRRLQVLPFQRSFTKEEDNPFLFPEIWHKEMPGILHQAILGLQRFRKNGGIKPPSDCQQAAIEFLVHSNPLFAFVEEKCKKGGKEGIFLPQFRKHMSAWAKAEGYKITVPGHTLKRQLEGLGFDVKKENGTYKVKGLSFTSDHDKD